MKNNFEKPEKEKSLVDNSVIKKAALVAGVTLVGIGNINAQEEPLKQGLLDDTKKTKEIGVEVKNKVDDGKTYYAAADFYKGGKASDAKPLEVKVINNIENNSRIAQLEVGTYFNTDLAEVTLEDKKVIEDNIRNILSQIRPENVSDFIKAEKKIYVASDERETNNWGGSNENLSIARGEIIKKILEEVFKSYKYNENLFLDNIKQLETSSFIIELFVSNTGPEKGVVYLTDVINPVTGENFTPIEVEELKVKNPVLYKQLLDNNRKVTILIGIENNENLEKIKPDPNLNEPIPNPNKPSLKPDEPPITPKISTIKHKKKIHLDIPKYYKKARIPKQFKTKTCVISKPVKSHFNKYKR